MASREEMSTSFGSEAGTYEAGRPDYPAEPVAWMLEPVRRRGPGAPRGGRRRRNRQTHAGRLGARRRGRGDRPGSRDARRAARARARRSHLRGIGRADAAARRVGRRAAVRAGVALGRRAGSIGGGWTCPAVGGSAGTGLEHPRRVRAMGAPPHRDHARQPRRGDDGRRRSAGRPAVRAGGRPSVAMVETDDARGAASRWHGLAATSSLRTPDGSCAHRGGARRSCSTRSGRWERHPSTCRT